MSNEIVDISKFECLSEEPLPIPLEYEEFLDLKEKSERLICRICNAADLYMKEKADISMNYCRCPECFKLIPCVPHKYKDSRIQPKCIRTLCKDDSCQMDVFCICDKTHSNHPCNRDDCICIKFINAGCEDLGNSSQSQCRLIEWSIPDQGDACESQKSTEESKEQPFITWGTIEEFDKDKMLKQIATFCNMWVMKNPWKFLIDYNKNITNFGETIHIYDVEYCIPNNSYPVNQASVTVQFFVEINEFVPPNMQVSVYYYFETTRVKYIPSEQIYFQEKILTRILDAKINFFKCLTY